MGVELVHLLQLPTYLRLCGRWMGLLVNFNTDRIENGLRRMAHRPFVRPSCSSWLRAANTPERSRADPKVWL
jgi:hypothetical protein